MAVKLTSIAYGEGVAMVSFELTNPIPDAPEILVAFPIELRKVDGDRRRRTHDEIASVGIQTLSQWCQSRREDAELALREMAQ